MITSREISETYCKDLPDWHHAANGKYIDGVHHSLKPGDVWIFPDARKLFKKVEGGWELIES